MAVSAKFPLSFSWKIFPLDGISLARYSRHLFVTGFIKSTLTTEFTITVITSTVLTFIVIVKEVLLKGLPKLGRNDDDKKVIYWRLAKVISDAILLVYSLTGVLVKIVRVSHEMAQFVLKIAYLWLFRWNQPHYWKRYPVTVSFPDYGSCSSVKQFDLPTVVVHNHLSNYSLNYRTWNNTPFSSYKLTRTYGRHRNAASWVTRDADKIQYDVSTALWKCACE